MEEIWKKFENIEVSNLGHLKTRNHKDGTWGGSNHSTGYKHYNSYKVHRLVAHLFLDMEIKFNETNHVDHINGNRSDNRVENLRIVTRRENGQNMKSHRDGRLYGCYCDTRHKTPRWIAQITIDNICIHLGAFDSEPEAHDMYDKCLNEYNKTGKILKKQKHIKIAVGFDKAADRFKVQYTDENGKRKHLGSFKTIEDAMECKNNNIHVESILK